ncbi:hypothetical protein RhiirC2_814874 [Rhizophagus irregularis]|uniref:Uncharacterized protein n=1 Tax=Rhizophagus irregularis TaxID=588596 RepID=A0A2N1MLB0_9GLOM|nr:hypothetical protein RhiirC2_814874 [Rhizophagus irregularis]
MGFGWVKMNTNSPPYTFHADAEAKKGLDVQPIFINPKFVPDATISSFWDSIGTIDRDIRKFSKTITDAQTFDSFTHNTKLQDTFSHHKLSDINWPVTQAWLKHNETSDVCSSEKSKKDAFKLNHILPCGDILTSHHPSLFRRPSIAKWKTIQFHIQVFVLPYFLNLTASSKTLKRTSIPIFLYTRTIVE